jgi:dTDP-4-dehydrorhamnose reductase
MKIYPHLHGLYQISSAKISKFDLLVLINKVFNLNIHIVPSDEYFCDRSLTSTKYKEKTNYHPYDWEEMISEMFTDKTNYERWEIQ